MNDSLKQKTKKRLLRLKRKTAHLVNTVTEYSPKLVILVYHRVVRKPRFNPLNTIVSLDTFTNQIEAVAKRYAVVSLSEAVNQCRSGKAKDKIQIVLTFDDGYADNYEEVFPVLKRKGLPAVFNVAADYIDSGTPLWDWEIIMRTISDKDINDIETRAGLFSKRRNETRLSFAFRLFEKMKSADVETIKGVVAALRQRTDARFDLDRESCMSWAQLRTMREAGMEIGSHSMTHRSLARIPFEEAKEEIVKSKISIEANLKMRCLNFAFPFGSRRDYSQALIDVVKDSGYDSCLLNIHGYNLLGPDIFCFKRIIMDEVIDMKYLLG